MLLDIGLGVPLIVAGLLGLRDGIVRKAVAIVAMLLGLYLAQQFMHTATKFLAENLSMGEAATPMYGFLAIFLGVVVLQGLLYRILAGGYKIGGVADRIVGAALGVGEGCLFLSSLLFILALQGTPSRDTSRDSRLYRPIVNIAPEFLDFVSTGAPETMQKFKESNAPEVLKDKEEGRHRAQSSDGSAGRTTPRPATPAGRPSPER